MAAPKKALLKSAFIVGSVWTLAACSGTNTRFVPDTIKMNQSLGIPVTDATPTPTPMPTPQPTPVPPVVVPTATPMPTPAPTPVPPVLPTPVVVPPTPAPTPVPVAKDSCQTAGISQKACYLERIMTLGCPLRDHRPSNYVAPSESTIISYMNKCDQKAYPYTAPTATQMDIINRLLDPNDPSFRQLIFTKLYYKPPFTEDFKKYFGVEIYNAMYVFCDNYGVPPGAGSIMPAAAVDNESPTYVLPADYQIANTYAQQLQDCVYASKSGK